MAAGIAAIQLLPTAELLFHSQRSAEVDTLTSMTYSFWPWHFLNFLNPHIFGHPITSDYWGLWRILGGCGIYRLITHSTRHDCYNNAFTKTKIG